MTFLIAMIYALIFVALCKTAIKRRPGIFYGLAIATAGLTIFYQRANLYEVFPEWVYTYVVSVFWRGAFATALFVIVMYLGAIDKKSSFAKQLMPIRGNLAIIASLITLAHSVVYGSYYVPALLSGKQFTTAQTWALILTVPLFLLMIVLMVTSFHSVRRRMKASHWKNLQRSAYVWFAILYVYLMVLFVPHAIKALNPASEDALFYRVNDVLSVVLYSAVFLTYFVLRIRKHLHKKDKSSVSVLHMAAR